MNTENIKKILIVGGGFGGISVALNLKKKKIPNSKIILLSDKPHFEYHAALYRVVTGKSPLEVCIPLREIFNDKGVEIIEDEVIEIDIKNKRVKGKSESFYNFDFLILALGSTTSYFDIPGLKEFSFGFKSINEALKLKRHIHNLFEETKTKEADEKIKSLNFIIVGGGASGVELAGELAAYLKNLSLKHKIDYSNITIDLIEAAPRILPQMPEDFSLKVAKRLRYLGVNIFINRKVIKEDIDEIYLKDIELKTKTVIWTAGVVTHPLYLKDQLFLLDSKKKVITDELLQAKGMKDIFIIGDAASTPYSGMAQTAVYDGKFVADVIEAKIKNKKMPDYNPKPPSYAIPVGPNWAAVMIKKKIKIYGLIGWLIRRLADLRFFLYILPFKKAILAFQNGKKITESCPICSQNEFYK